MQKSIDFHIPHLKTSKLKLPYSKGHGQKFWFCAEKYHIKFRWGFQCRACSFDTSKKSKIIKHVENEHGIVNQKKSQMENSLNIQTVEEIFQKYPSYVQDFDTEESSDTVTDRCLHITFFLYKTPILRRAWYIIKVLPLS